MKKIVITSIAAMYVGFVMLATSICVSSCSKTEPRPTAAPDAIKIKQALDSAAYAMSTPELVFTLDEITLIQSHEHPYQIAQSADCEAFCFKRSISGVNNYRVNVYVVLDYIASFGSDVDNADPRDINNDQMITMSDFVVILSNFGNEFETVPISSIEVTGGELSGAGELAFYSGELIADGETLNILSFFSDSNCFIQDYQPEAFDPSICYPYTMLTFATNVGTVKYYHIN